MTENKNNIPTQIYETPLESWKEIAVYLKRDVRTVIRWEKHEALPVRRHLHQARSSVYAYPSELEAWKAARQPGFDQAVAVMPWRRPIPAFSFALTLLLALVSVASGPILTPPGALAQEAGGMVVRQVWAGDFEGAVSPDGRYLSYTDWVTRAGDLAIRDLATGEKRYLTNKGTWADSNEYAEGWAWSPDSQQLAYAWFNKEFFSELRTIGLDSSEPQILYRNEEMNVWPHAWSSDGKHILATFTRKDGANRIGLVSVADGSVQVLKTLDWRWPEKMGFSPDGRYIVYDFPPKEESPERDIFVLAADGNREIRLVEHPANDVLLGWAPDGKHVLFASDRTGTMAAWVIQVAEGRRQGSPVLVKKDIGHILPIGFTRKGSFYYGLNTGMKDVYIATIDAGTGTVLAPPRKVSQRFVGSNTAPAWSPDGQYLAYVSEPEDHHFAAGVAPRIIIRSLKTGQERERLPALTYIAALRWSPDGRSLLLNGWARNPFSNKSLYRMDAQTGEVKRIVQNEPGIRIERAAWSPDGKAIFYNRWDDTTKSSSLVVRDLATGREKELYRLVPPPSSLRSFALSPDGRQVALVTGDPTQWTVLMVMPAAGGEPRELLTVPVWVDPIAWTPDGRAMFFVRDTKRVGTAVHHTHELWRIPAEGGEPQKIGLTMEGLSDLRFHPDGKRIAFTAGHHGREVWVLENFLPKPKGQAARREE